MDPFDFRRERWIETLHRWFDHWLQGIDNRVMREPMVEVEIAPGRWRSYRTWPLPAARRVILHLGPRCYGQSSSQDDGCYFLVEEVTTKVRHEVVSVGGSTPVIAGPCAGARSSSRAGSTPSDGSSSATTTPSTGATGSGS